MEAMSRKLKPENLGMEEESEEMGEEESRPSRKSAGSSRGKGRSRRAA
jgi:hypothetical protein